MWIKNLSSKRDLGQDGLYIKHDGTKVIFQSKWRANNKAITHTEISTFFSIAEHADERLLIRNTVLSNQAKESIEKKDNTWQIEAGFLSALSCDDFAAIDAFIQSSKPPAIKPRELWPIQEKAITDLLNLPHPKEQLAPERVTCVMPCGTGKTLVAMRYAEEIKAKRIVLLLPSLLLIEQAISDWRKDSKISTESFSWHVICSPHAKGKTKEDEIDAPKTNSPFPPSTSSEKVCAYLDKNTHRHQVIFCTYHSTAVLIEALNKKKVTCDLISRCREIHLYPAIWV